MGVVFAIIRLRRVADEGSANAVSEAVQSFVISFSLLSQIHCVELNFWILDGRKWFDLYFFVLWNEMASSVELWKSLFLPLYSTQEPPPFESIKEVSLQTIQTFIVSSIMLPWWRPVAVFCLCLSSCCLPAPSSQHPIFSSLSHTQQHAGATVPCRRHRVRQRYTLTSAVFPRAPPLHLSLTRYADTFKFKTSKSIFDNSQSL